MMKTLFWLLAFAVFGISVSAAEVKPPTFVPASGLQLSLNTGGYKFFVGDAPPAATKAQVAKLGGLLPVADGFAASVILANRSRTAIPFELNDAGAAAVKFRFSVSDESGALIWQSDSGLGSAQVKTPATLGKGQRWKRIIQIPLKVDGVWLPPGRYTLTATLAATPSVSATATFEVENFSGVLPLNTGITGRIFQSGIVAWPALADVLITEKRLPGVTYDHPPFTWTGQTNGGFLLGNTLEGGRFSAATPSGTFVVSASFPKPSYEYNTPLPVTTEVVVAKGSYAETSLSIYLGGGFSTGIRGVVISSGNAFPALGGGRGIASATISIEEIRTPGVQYSHLPWSTKTSSFSDGRFWVATLPGRYRVAVTPPALAGPVATGLAGTGATAVIRPQPNRAVYSVEVVVDDGNFTPVTLSVDTSIP